MCGIVGHVSTAPVNQRIYDSLLLLQHRGQDSTGIATVDDNSNYHIVKHRGQVREAYRTRDMRNLIGSVGLGHVRYATSGNAGSEDEVQPFYVNAPYGLVLVHNGNITNTRELAEELFKVDRRHLNSASDTEILLNILANALQESLTGKDLSHEDLFNAVTEVHRRVNGTYAAIALVGGHGLLAFRDPYGVRPLVLGRRLDDHGRTEWVVASESLVLSSGGYQPVRDVEPGEAVFITSDGELYSRQCSDQARLVPDAFEYVYLARPDSTLDGISVYGARLRMGETLAKKIRNTLDLTDIDVVMPIPDSGRPTAMELARTLDKPYREGFYKNHYVGRTFIMPGQTVRKKSVRQKLNALPEEFKGKNVLLVDDSIVRGTTSKQIVEMARTAGARSVIFASAAPAIRHPNVYGINMPTRAELVAHNRTDDEVAEVIGADALVYQDIDDMVEAITAGTDITELEVSCFTGEYITGDVTEEYLGWLEETRVS